MNVSAGEIIKRCRKRARLTQEELAERAGYDSSSIAKWESGKHDPRVSSFDDVLQAMGLELTIIKKVDEYKETTWE